MIVSAEHEIDFELVKDTGRALETMAETKLDQWPYFLPLAEGKRRTRTLPSGHQPLALSRGYYACTALETAMGALRAIPAPHHRCGRNKAPPEPRTSLTLIFTVTFTSRERATSCPAEPSCTVP